MDCADEVRAFSECADKVAKVCMTRQACPFVPQVTMQIDGDACAIMYGAPASFCAEIFLNCTCSRMDCAFGHMCLASGGLRGASEQHSTLHPQGFLVGQKA